MLEYKISVNQDEVTKSPIGVEDFVINEALTQITCSAQMGNTLLNNDIIYVKGFNGQTEACQLSAKRVCRSGYVDIDVEYPEFTGYVNNHNLFITPDDGEEFTYIFRRGVFYYKKNGTYVILDEKSGKEKSCSIENGLVTIAERFYIEDGYVNINGNLYFANNNGDKVYLTLEEGDGGEEPIITSSYFYPTPQYYDNLEIQRYDNPTLAINDISCGDYEYYVHYMSDLYSGGTNVYFDNYYDGDDSLMTHSASTEEWSITYKDDFTSKMGDGSLVEINGQNYKVHSNIINTNYSDKILIDSDDDLMVGDIIIAKQGIEDYHTLSLYTTDNGDEYIVFNGDKHFINAEPVKMVTIFGREYRLYKGMGGVAFTNFGGQYLAFYNKYDDITHESDIIRPYFDGKYTVHWYKGVTIDGVVYKLDYNIEGEDAGNQVTIYASEEFEFDVIDSVGSSLYLCTPRIRIGGINGASENIFRTGIATQVASNMDRYDFSVKNTLFGYDRYDEQIGFANGLDIGEVTSSLETFNIHAIQPLKNDGYYNISIPFKTLTQPNPGLEHIVEKDFFEYEKEKSINRIVDMEKDIYYPMTAVWDDSADEGIALDENGRKKFLPIHEINFNLHFRTRTLDNWKVIEDNEDTELNEELSGLTNWFITDYEPYKSYAEGDKDHQEELIRTSDLMGLINYSNTDIHRQRNNVERSFLRLSIYDSMDPKNQSLLSTSTIWVDEGDLSLKYIKDQKVTHKTFKHVYETLEQYEDEDNIAHSLSVSSERVDDDGNLLLNENDRISSRFMVTSKFDTDNESSEGFYFYIFKEYAEKLRPKKVYMKVEYNHAGIGRKLPFLMPMKWAYDTGKKTSMMAIEPLTLDADNTNEGLVEYMNGKSDLEILKQGYPLNQLYQQLYIPLNVIYDDINNHYIYYPDAVYCNDTNLNDGVLEWNLFEIKVMDKYKATLIKDISMTVLYNGVEYDMLNSDQGSEVFTITQQAMKFAFFVSVYQEGTRIPVTSVKFTDEEINRKFKSDNRITNGEKQDFIYFELDEPLSTAHPTCSIEITAGDITKYIKFEYDDLLQHDGGGSYASGTTIAWNAAGITADSLLAQVQSSMQNDKNSLANIKYYFAYEPETVESQGSPEQSTDYIQEIRLNSTSYFDGGVLTNNESEYSRRISFTIIYKQEYNISSRTYTIIQNGKPKEDETT